MREHRQSGPRVSAVVVLAVVASFVTSCRTEIQRPATVYDLVASGVVESVEGIEGGRRVWVAGGESIEVPFGGVALGSEVVPPGSLLLVGSDGATTAYLTLRENGDCYVLGEPALDDGAHLVFDFGLRLPKAPGFDPGPVDDGHFSAHPFEGSFCINPAGEAVRYGV